jgi:hypothetical protein
MPEMVPITALLPAESPRLVGENPAHVRLLARSGATLPPILVDRASRRVIDGMHRLGAARMRGRSTIAVQYFDGGPAEAFIAAVRANVTHGLPLSRHDREAAVARIVATHPHWSDRAIAAVTGLAATTVAGIRRRTEGRSRQPAARIGRDGRVRPVNSAPGRRRAGQVLADRPEASLREVARLAGVSPATARDVRDRVRRGEDPVRRRCDRRTAAPPPEPASPVTLRDLTADPSLRYVESGRALLRWLHARALRPAEWRAYVEPTPPHCAYLVARLARDLAREWLEFADQLERRVEGSAAR